MVTSGEVVDLISDLVAIDSVTPWLVEGGAGEAGIVEFVRSWLEGLPIEIDVHVIEPGRFNVVATLRGSGGGASLCVNAHADTVGYAGWPETALTARLEGDRLYGLGAADDKAGCAIGLCVLRHFATVGPRLRGDLVVALVADEEGISIGSEHLVARLRTDMCVVIEPDGLPRVVVEHQGFGWIDVVAYGRAAHGSVPDEGVDAIVGLSQIVSHLHRLDQSAYAATSTSRNGRTVFHTGTIRGGTDYATYPSEATLGIEIGTQPNETLDDRVKEITDIIATVGEGLPGLSAEVVVRVEREPFRANGHEMLLAALRRGVRRHLGKELDEAGLNAWTDAALMQSAGIATVMMGPLGGNLHCPNEWVSVAEAVSTVDILVEAIEELLS